MKEYRTKFAVEKMCKVFRVSRSGFYQWLGRRPSQRMLEREELAQLIMQIYRQSRCNYGSPKITIALQKLGYKVSRPRVARIMKELGIKSIINRKYRGVTTDSKHKEPVASNILNREFSAAEPGEKWVSDLTYIPTKRGWVYLTIILDLYDRRILGWSLSRGMSAKETIIPAWLIAKRKCPIKNRLIFHSDRGIQYACADFRNLLDRQLVQQSMSRKGNCWDNAVAESFFKILKSEMVNHRQFEGYKEAKIAIFEFIEVWYHQQRSHSALNYMTPNQFLNFKKRNVA